MNPKYLTRLLVLSLVSRSLCSRARVVHLGVDLADELVDAPQLRLDGLELLRRLDRVPVLCVGADVNVELDVAARGATAAGCCGRDQLQCSFM